MSAEDDYGCLQAGPFHLVTMTANGEMAGRATDYQPDK